MIRVSELVPFIGDLEKFQRNEHAPIRKKLEKKLKESLNETEKQSINFQLK